jgi:hypothetical protein
MGLTLPALAALLAGSAVTNTPALPAAQGAAAADSTRMVRSLSALRLDAGDRVRLDGLLDEEFWQRATIADGFLQQDPHSGQPASESTEVRVAYDDQNLYIGVMLHDRDPDGVIGRALQRDAGLGSDDRFMFILDTFMDGRTGYFFEINPAGLMGDGLLRGSPGGMPVNKSWDGIWEARVKRGDHGWSAEIRIPFRTLNFDPSRDTWGINFQRTVRRRSEESLWSGHPRNQGLFRPEHAGHLTGLSGLSQGLGLEVKPYAVASWGGAPGRGLPDADTPSDVGFDMTYSITPSLRASVTVNTDFAEAEVDQRRVNLTRFAQSFPERRDFFLEGSSVYAFAQASGPSPYFSRRIGLDDGQPVPIVAGGRLAGQLGAFDVGFLQVRTDAHPAGPAEDFTVARARRNVLRSSMIGAIYTRRAPHDLEGFDRPDAHTVGFDADVYTSRFRGNRNLQLEAFFVAHTDARSEAARNTLQSDIGDLSARGIRLNYPNDPVRAHISVREFGNLYDPAVGFVPRRGFRRTQPTVTWTPRPSGISAVRQLDLQVQLEHLTDLAGNLETFNVQGRVLGVRFESGDNIDIDVRRDFERLQRNFRISDGVIIQPGDYSWNSWEVNARSAGRRVVSVNASLAGGGFWSGNRLQQQFGGSWTPRAGVSVNGNWERNDVNLPEGAFTTNLVRAGGGWQFSPWMSLNGNVQYDDVTRALGTFTRFRWTIRPGSDLYLVYTHNLRDGLLLPDPREQRFATVDHRAATKLTYTYRF